MTAKLAVSRQGLESPRNDESSTRGSALANLGERSRIGPDPAGYLPYIDGLRAFAVLSVVTYHAFPKYVRGGFIGVDVFFVISGFLISFILFGKIHAGDFGFRAFYAGRARRLFPALTVVLVAVLGYGFVILAPSELAQLGKHVAGGSLSTVNLMLWDEAGYFDRVSSAKPLLHLWSLGVEEQFYLVWPVTLWVMHRFGLPTLPILVLLLLVSLGLNLAMAGWNPAADFFSPLTRIWEFAAGAILAWLFFQRGTDLATAVSRMPRPHHVLSLGGAALLLSTALLLDDQQPYPGWRAMLPVAGALLLLAAGPLAVANRVLATRGAVLLGRISYPLYLWHWPLLSMAIIIRRKPPSLLLAFGLIAVSLVLAWATARFVEKPLRFGPHARRQTGLVVILLASAGGLGFWTWKAQAVVSHRTEFHGVDVAKVDAAVGDGIFRPTAGMAVTLIDRITVAKIGTGDPPVILTGDSVVFQYGPRVQKLLDEGRLARTVYFVVGQSCSPIPDAPRPDRFATCSAMSRIRDDLVRRTQADTVVFGALWGDNRGPNVFVTRGGTRMPLTTKEAVDQAYLNLSDEVVRLQHEGVQVALILPTPAHERFNPESLIVRSPFGYRLDPEALHAVPVAPLRSASAADEQHLRAIAKATGAELLDPFPDVCGRGPECSPVFADGEPKYADQLHLRPIFVRDNITFLDDILTSKRASASPVQDSAP